MIYEGQKSGNVSEKNIKVLHSIVGLSSVRFFKEREFLSPF